ncbi:hypothetical protein BaRGS_00038531 [Batillaria attramentaria]|uniref:Ig-like domain-containing protein n=1 Tax=Batillaria attramentaria TaxID=370345 RepID=A0ABD0J5D2_9CAEN
MPFSPSGLQSTCTAKSYGTSGRVECTFSTDLNRSKDNFVIQRYDFKAGLPPDRVITCIWTAVGLRCQGEPSYRLDHQVSSKVVVEIPKITKKHEGRYYCYGIPSESDQAEVCELRITDNAETLYLVIGILTGILVTVAVTAAVWFLLYRKRKRKANRLRNDRQGLRACNGLIAAAR